MTPEPARHLKAVPEPTAPAISLPVLPDEFWAERGVLADVRRAAYSRRCSPDGTLGVVLARIAAATHPAVTLPALVGTYATLDFIVGLVGPAGGGKSSTMGCGRDLLAISEGGESTSAPSRVLDGLTIGSGEGLIDAYLGAPRKDEGGLQVRDQVVDGVYGVVDEIQSLQAQSGRKGSTLDPTLRTMWSGGAVGQANASADRCRHLPARSARLSAVIGAQPEYAAQVLADSAGGTPQRLLWLSAVHPGIPDEAPSWPTWSWTPVDRGHTIDVCSSAATEVTRAHLARARGGVVADPLDAHADLLRLKVAALLGLMEGRPEVAEDDWQLAGQIMTTSRAVRSVIVAQARAQEARSERVGNERAARKEIHVGDAVATAAATRMSRAAAKKVHSDHCADGCLRRCLTQATRGSDRKLATIDEAIEHAIAEGWIVERDGRFWPGGSAPA